MGNSEKRVHIFKIYVPKVENVCWVWMEVSQVEPGIFPWTKENIGVSSGEVLPGHFFHSFT